MRIKEIEVAGNKLTVHELQDMCDPNTGTVLSGSWVWDSAVYLSKWIVSQGRVEFQIEGKTVVELGAGTGLPGLVAASLGAGRVILTDIAALLLGLQRSVEANGFSERVEVRELLWGWDEFSIGVVDLVLMSDVFYDPSEMPVLAKTLKGLCGRETRIWAASEVRMQTGDCLAVLKGEGFGVVELPLVSADDLKESTEEQTLFAVFILTPPQALSSIWSSNEVHEELEEVSIQP